MEGGMNNIHIVRGSVVDMATDAIVNAANNSLLGGGGVDGAIHAAAGPGLLEECSKLGGCKTGNAKITKGYNLKAKHVIHTVGPICNGEVTFDQAALLAFCYMNSLQLAYKNKLHSIAFCCISTGAYGFPLDKASMIAVHFVKNWLEATPDADMDVYFCCYNDREFAIYNEILNC